MRWWLLLFILWASPALAQWVEFTPCGLADFERGEVSEAFSGPAPNILSYWIWAPYVVAVFEIKGHPRSKVWCSQIQAISGTRLVIGTADEVLKKLGKK